MPRCKVSILCVLQSDLSQIYLLALPTLVGAALNVSFSKPRAKPGDETVSDRKLFIGQVRYTSPQSFTRLILRCEAASTQQLIRRFQYRLKVNWRC